MMNHGLLAPQFGLVGRGMDLDETPPQGTVPGVAPTVIVKKRRSLALVPVTELEPGAPPAQGAVAKESKVYRLDTLPPAVLDKPEPIFSQPLASSAPLDEAVVLSDEPPAPVHPPRLRRKQDPIRKPTLLSHVVFEASGLAEGAAAQAGAVQDTNLAPPLSRTAEPAVRLEDIQRAMNRLDETLASVATARRLNTELTALLRGKPLDEAPVRRRKAAGR